MDAREAREAMMEAREAREAREGNGKCECRGTRTGTRSSEKRDDIILRSVEENRLFCAHLGSESPQHPFQKARHVLISNIYGFVLVRGVLEA